jgi:hypothetical protein
MTAMTEYQQVLDREMGTPPPSTVDVDRIIRRQRRRTRLRDLGIAGSAGAAALTMAVIYTMLQGNAPPRDAGTPPAEPGATASARTTGPGPVGTSSPGQPVTPTDPAVIAPLADVLRQQLRDAIPGVQFVAFDSGRPSEFALVFRPGGIGHSASARLQDAAGSATFLIEAGRGDITSPADVQCSGDPKPLDIDEVNCEVVDGPSGARLMVLTVENKGFSRYVLELVRTDGAGLRIEMSTAAASMVDEGPPLRPTMPLTKAQVTELAMALAPLVPA